MRDKETVLSFLSLIGGGALSRLLITLTQLRIEMPTLNLSALELNIKNLMSQRFSIHSSYVSVNKPCDENFGPRSTCQCISNDIDSIAFDAQINLNDLISALCN